MSGGLMGVAERKVHGGAAASATGNQTSGALGGLGGKVYQNSLAQGGDFANTVIGSVAHGSIAQMGSITGEGAAAALQSYMPMMNVSDVENSMNNSTQVNGDSVSVQQTDNSAAPSIPMSSGETSVSGGIPAAPGVSDVDGIEVSNSIPASPISAPDGVSSGINESAPIQYSGVEIGGGRISGYETASVDEEPRRFAMYSAEQYMKPESHYTTVTAIDDSKWYKQYAQAAVEKTPYSAPNGGVAYNEKIVQKLPPMPRRKDRV
jgi:hypothetical protein